MKSRFKYAVAAEAVLVGIAIAVYAGSGPAVILKVGKIAVYRLPGQAAFFYKAGMTVDADGAPAAYHPRNIGLDDLGNAGKPGRGWALVTDNGKANGKPVVQPEPKSPAHPAPGYYISMTSLVNQAIKDSGGVRRYVDATADASAGCGKAAPG